MQISRRFLKKIRVLQQSTWPLPGLRKHTAQHNALSGYTGAAVDKLLLSITVGNSLIWKEDYSSEIQPEQITFLLTSTLLNSKVWVISQLSFQVYLLMPQLGKMLWGLNRSLCYFQAWQQLLDTSSTPPGRSPELVVTFVSLQQEQPRMKQVEMLLEIHSGIPQNTKVHKHLLLSLWQWWDTNVAGSA